MNIIDVPFCAIDWNAVTHEEYDGISGTARWKVVQQGNVRVRIVEYSPGYLADHWCEKGHVVTVLEGEFTSELKDGRMFHLTQGMSYIVADKTDAHRSSTTAGVRLLIVD
jgi:quercetin dioxygenase-like cupin family protein